MKNHLIVIAGPTAVGKTALAIQLAKHFNTEIISADSRQFYQELSIGTAKPTTEELDAVPHHFINNLSISEEYNVGKYEKEVLNLLDELFKEHQVVILCGGSGLFIDAVCNGMDDLPESNREIREQVMEEYADKGLEWLQQEVKRLDPVYFNDADQQNPHRLVRALEVCLSTGKPYSSFRLGEKKKRDFHIVKILLDTDREKLYERINKRVDEMMQNGLLEEVRSVLQWKNANALNTVGYKELIAYLEGKSDLETSVNQIRQNSRRYAKRQLTWFRNDEDYTTFEPTDLEKIKAFLEMVISY